MRGEGVCKGCSRLVCASAVTLYQNHKLQHFCNSGLNDNCYKITNGKKVC